MGEIGARGPLPLPVRAGSVVYPVPHPPPAGLQVRTVGAVQTPLRAQGLFSLASVPARRGAGIGSPPILDHGLNVLGLFSLPKAESLASATASHRVPCLRHFAGVWPPAMAAARAGTPSPKNAQMASGSHRLEPIRRALGSLDLKTGSPLHPGRDTQTEGTSALRKLPFGQRQTRRGPPRMCRQQASFR
jgi:hypothetical protein